MSKPAKPPTQEPFAERFPDTLTSLLKPVDGWGNFRPGARPAAVTIVLYARAGTWHVVFVSRRADLPDHPGQVALPGGTVRAGEDAWAAAAREVEEEIGVPADALRPLGAGPAVYTSVSNFSVVPFVAVLDQPPAAFQPDPRELEAVLEIPLERLLADDGWLESVEPWMGRHFPWSGGTVWGLTARILDGVLPALSEALRPSGRRPGPPAAPGSG